MRGEVIDVSLGEVNVNTAGGTRRVDHRECAVRSDTPNVDHGAGGSFVVRGRVEVDPLGSLKVRDGSCGSLANIRSLEPRCRGRLGKLAAKLAEHGGLRTVLDEAECCRIPERTCAAVCEQHLVSVRYAIQLRDTLSDIVNELFHRLLPVRRTDHGGGAIHEIAELLGTHERGARSESPILGEQICRNTNFGHADQPKAPAGFLICRLALGALARCIQMTMQRRVGNDVADLIDTTEMYLRTILDLEEEGITPLRARISERLGHSGPTVSQTIARMERDGLVEVAPDRRLVLSEDGREKATRVMRKHRIAESLLANVIGLDLAQVHDEACRWEHVMSDDVERRLIEVLQDPRTSPYGNPIPGLAQLGLDRTAVTDERLVRLTEIPHGQPTAVVVRRLAEYVQSAPEVIARLREAGVVPDARVTVETKPGSVSIAVAGHDSFELSDEMAHAVQVKQV